MSARKMKVGGRPAAARSLALAAVLLAAWAVLPASGNAQAEETGGIGGTGITGETGGIGGTGIKSPSGEETGGIGGTGVRSTAIVGYGPIQRFGSVFVNDREYAITGQTLVSIDDAPATAAALRVGDITKVRGVATGPHSGLALSISVRDAIIGTVSGVNRRGSAFTVLGQNVVAATKGMPFAGIRSGDTVAVSAQRLANGSWAAQRVSVMPPNDRFRLEATVTGVGTDRIAVAGTTVMVPRGLAADVRPGQRAVVTGILTGGVLRATGLTVRPIALGAPGTRVEVQNYFRTDGTGRIVAADGMVATGAPAKTDLTGLTSVEIDGRLITPDTIAIDHIDIDTPVAPDLTSTSESTGSAATPEGQEPTTGEVAEPQASPDSEVVMPPDDIGSPVEIEPPEVEEPQATPDVEPPDVEPPHIDHPTPHVEPPEIDLQPDK